MKRRGCADPWRSPRPGPPRPMRPQAPNECGRPCRHRTPPNILPAGFVWPVTWDFGKPSVLLGVTRRQQALWLATREPPEPSIRIVSGQGTADPNPPAHRDETATLLALVTIGTTPPSGRQRCRPASVYGGMGSGGHGSAAVGDAAGRLSEAAHGGTRRTRAQALPAGSPLLAADRGWGRPFQPSGAALGFRPAHRRRSAHRLTYGAHGSAPAASPTQLCSQKSATHRQLTRPQASAPSASASPRPRAPLTRGTALGCAPHPRSPATTPGGPPRRRRTPAGRASAGGRGPRACDTRG